MPYTAVASPSPQTAAPPAQQQTPVPDARMSSASSVGSRLSALSRIQQRPHHKRLGKYIIGQTIGEGEFGKVKLAWAESENGEKRQYAIKLLRQDRLRGIDKSQRDKVYHEINALQACRHPHVIRLEDLLKNVHYIGIVLDYASGGDMFAYIYKKGRLDERTSQRLFAQLVSGVHYLHQKGIVHRDLKLENLLLDGNNRIVISDFGFANSFRSSRGYTLMKTSCGSPCYAAPEVVNSDKNYDGRKVDVWSVGVILFTFLAGYLPFDDDPNNPESDDIQQLYRYITTTPVKFPDWIGGEARDLIRRILVVDPERRAKMQDIMAHRWLAEHRSFLSITPAEHEGSAPWQRRSSAAAASSSVQYTNKQQQQLQQQQQQLHQQQSQTQSQQFSLARSASAAAAASSRTPTSPVMQQRGAGNVSSRGTRPPVRSSSMTPASISLQQDPRDIKRQSAYPTVSYSNGHNRTASKMEEVPELAIASAPKPPQPHLPRLAPATKPRPISFQPKTDSSFELVNGSSLYMPKTSQPRVSLNRESSKSGEMSRPLSYVAENDTISTSPVPNETSHEPSSQHRHTQSVQYPQHGQQTSHVRRYSLVPNAASANSSMIPRSTSIHLNKNDMAQPPSTPVINNEIPAALQMQTPGKPEMIPPTRRTSVRSSAVQPSNNHRYSGVPDMSKSNTSSADPNISSEADATTSIPPSRSKFRLSSAWWSRKSSTNADTTSKPQEDRRASFVSSQSPSQANAAAGAAVAASNRRQSAIPVKSNKESSNLKKKTVNFFKRRSMIG